MAFDSQMCRKAAAVGDRGGKISIVVAYGSPIAPNEADFSRVGLEARSKKRRAGIEGQLSRDLSSKRVRNGCGHGPGSGNHWNLGNLERSRRHRPRPNRRPVDE